MFDCDEFFTSESDDSLPSSPIYDRYHSRDGYHDVPPPYTGTFMPPKPDLVFHNSPNVNETVHTYFNVKLSPTKPNTTLSPTQRPSEPIIEDWVSDSEDDSEAEISQNVPSFVQPIEQIKTPRPSVKTIETSIPTINTKTTIPNPTSNGNHRNIKACFVCNSLDHLIKDYDFYEKKMVQPPIRNHTQKGHHQQYARNMSYLSNFEELNGGYVAFVGNPKGGKIYGKGKIRTGKLDFDDVYFVKELKFNLFSVSQMCDKKNKVLFRDTECIVFSPEFKLPDENQVQLRVPRENNIYNVDLKNIIPT
nr:ribonuclease H-like domain-containing protein [Tanacetum cinerariifolium]